MPVSNDLDKGIIEIASNYSVDQTVERIRGILAEKGATLFAVVDHSGEAEKVGLKMPPTKLMIYGNPRAGTPVMLSAPSIAVDLPLKILVRQDLQGKVWFSWNSPEYLQRRHGLPDALVSNLAGIVPLLQKVTESESMKQP